MSKIQYLINNPKVSKYFLHINHRAFSNSLCHTENCEPFLYPKLYTKMKPGVGIINLFSPLGLMLTI